MVLLSDLMNDLASSGNEWVQRMDAKASEYAISTVWLAMQEKETP